MHTSSRLDPGEAVGLISAELARGDLDFALRFVLQTITDLPRASAAEFTELAEHPSRAGDQRFDTLLALAIAAEAEHRNIPAPGWTQVPPLESDWIVWADEDGPSEEYADRIRARTPEPYASHRVFISRRDIVSY
jgi:hypothetical protein